MRTMTTEEVKFIDKNNELEFKSENAKARWNKIQEKNSNNGVPNVFIKYARIWGKLMQKQIEQGKRLEDIALQASFDADLFGISGSVYAYATTLLISTWKYGAELRKFCQR